MADAARETGSGGPSRAAGAADIRAVPGRTGQTGQGGGRTDIEPALLELRARVDEEFEISQRLDSKMRQAFALAVGYFAVVQTVAFGSFAERGVNPSERLLLLVAVIAAGFGLLAVAHRLTNGEELLDEHDTRPDAIIQWLNEAAADDYVPSKLVVELAETAKDRTANNAIRGRNYDAVVAAARSTIIFTTVELLMAITVRL